VAALGFGIGVGLLKLALARRFALWHYMHHRLMFEQMFLSEGIAIMHGVERCRPGSLVTIPYS